MRRRPVMRDATRFLGLDVHAETIAVAVAEPGRGEVRSLGIIANELGAIRRLIQKLGKKNLRACYEAGPTGFALYRQLVELGIECEVIAPTLIPKTAADRIKTDRRDALMLARCYRAGDLTPVWVPDRAHEALRDLVRAREAAKYDQHRAKQRLSKFLLREGQNHSAREVLRGRDPAGISVGEGGHRWAPSAARRRKAKRGHAGGRDRKFLSLRVCEAAHGVLRRRAERALQWKLSTTGRDHQDRERTRTPGPVRMRLGLPTSTQSRRKAQATTTRAQCRHQRDRAQSAAPIASSLPRADGTGQAEPKSLGRHRPRAPRVHLGARRPGRG